MVGCMTFREIVSNSPASLRAETFETRSTIRPILARSSADSFLPTWVQENLLSCLLTKPHLMVVSEVITHGSDWKSYWKNKFAAINEQGK
jgi:hypothetical protein